MDKMEDESEEELEEKLKILQQKLKQKKQEKYLRQSKNDPKPSTSAQEELSWHDFPTNFESDKYHQNVEHPERNRDETRSTYGTQGATRPNSNASKNKKATERAENQFTEELISIQHSSTFQKRPGTTDKGKEYEVLSIANIAMNLAVDEEIKDFNISSNDNDFGAFDDIVIEAELENGTEYYALQLKHNDRGKLLSLNHFTQPTGDFSLQKYCNSWQRVKVPKKGFKFILSTNMKFNVKIGTKFQLNGEDFFITPSEVSSNNCCKILQTGHCYKFSIVKEYASCDNSDKSLLYEEFFDSFFLYSNQENMNKLKLDVTDNFKTLFCGNDVESKEYVNFINEWSLQEGKIEKLNKKWIKLVIALKIFSSRIQPLSFNHNNDIEDTNIVKRNMLREAIDAFDISIFQNKSYDQVRELWNDTKCELEDLKALNKLRTEYQISSTYISDISKVHLWTLSILLWLKGKCPLILTQDASVHKALELCPGEKFILLKNDLFPENVAAFKTLSDLEAKTPHYNRLVENLTCSLQGKTEIPLINLINGNEEILTVIKSDDLIEMAKGQCTIAEAEETLPVPYIERSLLKYPIDIKIIDNITKDTQVVLDCVSQKNYLNNTFQKHNLVDINDYLNSEIQQERSLNIESITTIYLSEKRCELSEFNEICNNNANVKHFHQFRLMEDGNLEWIRSKGGVSDLEKYKASQHYSVQERDLNSSKFENNINLLVSDPGMGKSELMKSFKINCFSDCFTVIIDPKDVYSFLKDASNDDSYVNIFEKFLLDEKFKTLSERDRDIFRIILKTNKIVYVWDALDELSDEYREIVTDIIIELSQNCVQWVTSRCHLQNMLEWKFNVLSLNLTKFDEQEQNDYIKQRLGGLNSAEDIKIIINKIKSSFALVEHKDILGIPLQIFMLTELFRQDREKYLKLLNNFFPLTDLYNYFIQDKIDIYYREKLGIVLNRILAKKMLQSQKDKLLAEYTNAALKLLFPDTILKKLGVQNEQSLQSIEENYKNVGLITDMTDQTPRFLHNSFAEYLASRYLAKNFKHKRIQAQDFFDPKYNNVRFFFDLLLAKDNEAHIAILYKNFSFIQSCDSHFLESTDLGRRSVLHLACSWGQRYPELNVKYTGHTCIVDDAEMYSTIAESNEYFETIDYLLKKCILSKTDKIHNMTPEEYARNTKCLAAEMRIMMNQNIQQSIENTQIINILCYSAYHGYYHGFLYFFEQLKRNSAQQAISRTESKFSSNLIIKNNIGETLLLQAAKNGHVEIVEFLIKADAGINLADNERFTPLYLASLHGHEKIVEFLVEAGAGINLANDTGFTPLHAASLEGHEKIAEFLVKAGADINLVNNDGLTPLFAASRNGYEKIVEFLVTAGAGINLACNEGYTPLYVASWRGHDKIVEFLVKAGAAINRACNNGFTPLIAASLRGHDNIVEFLVKAGAGINLAGISGFTPLNAASWEGHEKIVEILVKAGAGINLGHNDSYTPLYVASMHGHDKIIEFLVKAGAGINFAKYDGSTPLYAASENGHDKIVEFLVEAGADVNLANNDGLTPLHIGCQKGHEQLVDFLIKEGADINLAAKDGKTALRIALLNGHIKIAESLVKSHDDPEKIIELLIQKEAEINLPGQNGITELSVAAESRIVFLKESVNMLLVQFSIQMGVELIEAFMP